MSEMITTPALERAARAALLASHRLNGGSVDGDLLWRSIGPDAREDWLTSTRAVLVAVREPDKQAVRAGCIEFEDTEGLEQGDPRWIDGYDYLIPPTEKAFTAMIDAILGERGDQ